MKTTVFEQALELPVDERAKLAAALIQSLDGAPDDDVESVWAAEIEKRVGDIRTGNVQLETWDTVRERARMRLSGR